MSHAIATKLGNVTCGATLHAVRYIVHKHEKNGFRMLYTLLKISHPRLTHNKAIRPDRPTFDGDLPRLINKYQNFLSYEKQREEPRLYALDEQAEDVIFAIKQSPWFDKLKDGVKGSEEKLQVYKNHRFDRKLFPFPHDLKLHFISQTIMQYYIDRNVDPLSSLHKITEDIEKIPMMTDRFMSDGDTTQEVASTIDTRIAFHIDNTISAVGRPFLDTAIIIATT